MWPLSLRGGGTAPLQHFSTPWRNTVVTGNIFEGARPEKGLKIYLFQKFQKPKSSFLNIFQKFLQKWTPMTLFTLFTWTYPQKSPCNITNYQKYKKFLKKWTPMTLFTLFTWTYPQKLPCNINREGFGFFLSVSSSYFFEGSFPDRL